MKPLMMMRTRGISGPGFSKHAGVPGLSKSVGNSIGVVSPPIPPNPWVLTLNGTNWMELSEPVEFSADFEIEIKLSTNSTQELTLIGSSSNFYRYTLNIPQNELQFKWGFTNFYFNISSLNLNDGVRHTITLNYNATSKDMKFSSDNVAIETLNGNWDNAVPFSYIAHKNGGSSNFQGIIYSSYFIDLSGPQPNPNRVSWNIDCHCTDRQKSNEFPNDATKDLKLINVTPGNWSQS